MAAQRVPPSALMTSQSTMKARSPRMSRFVTATQGTADEALYLVGAPADAAEHGFAG